MKLKFYLTILDYNGGPKVKFLHDDKIIGDMHFTNVGEVTQEFDIDFQTPTKLKVEMYGKNMKYDTLVQGNKIINDKAVIINRVDIGAVSLGKEIHVFQFYKDNGDVIDKINYIGYNGTFVIDIDDELTKWYLKLQKQFINKMEKFDLTEFRREIFEEQH